MTTPTQLIYELGCTKKRLLLQSGYSWNQRSIAHMYAADQQPPLVKHNVPLASLISAQEMFAAGYPHVVSQPSSSAKPDVKSYGLVLAPSPTGRNAESVFVETVAVDCPVATATVAGIPFELEGRGGSFTARTFIGRKSAGAAHKTQ